MSGVEIIALRIAREIREEREALAQHNPPTPPKKAPMTQTPAPAPEKSTIVLMTFGFLIMSIFLAVVAIGVPSLAPLAIVAGLAAVTYAVLSLREL